MNRYNDQNPHVVVRTIKVNWDGRRHIYQCNHLITTNGVIQQYKRRTHPNDQLKRRNGILTKNVPDKDYKGVTSKTDKNIPKVCIRNSVILENE